MNSTDPLPIVEVKKELVVYCPDCNDRQKWDGDHIYFCGECACEFNVNCNKELL
jgi:hypothetical protein